MNANHHHDPHDDGDFLPDALRSAADDMPGSEAEMHLQFGVLRDRIRRRRLAKVGGTSVAALAVVGALAFGGLRLNLSDDAALPADPSPSITAREPSVDASAPRPSSSPQETEPSTPDADSASPDPTSTDAATSDPETPDGGTADPAPSDAFQEGYAPGDIYAGTGLVCGADAAGLVGSSPARGVEFDGGVFGRQEGDAVTPYATIAVRDAAGPAAIDFPPAAAWLRDGQVVNLSRYFDAEPPQVEVDDDGVARTDLRLDTTDACSPPPGAADQPSHEPVVYTRVLPAGEYRVLPVVWSNTNGRWTYVSGAPLAVEVLADGSIAGVG